VGKGAPTRVHFCDSNTRPMAFRGGQLEGGNLEAGN